MEKSIESIWKQGFLESNAILAPKLNNLYNKKSIHIVDKFKRMFKINLIAIVVLSVVILVVSILVKIPVMGVLMFILLNALVIVNKKLLKSLNAIDTNENSYQYIKSFDGWMKTQISINEKMSRFIYPYIFIAMVSGFWFSGPFRETLNRIFGDYQPYMVYGIPLFWILGMLLIVILLAIFGGRIYKWDLNLVYGQLLKKLNELITDMEDLRT
tara:strand:- start:72018 stop:72656 length:639 start_codon:yes stop_codon:yes gene_type:complete